MGIYIKGLEMPESCHECLAGFGGGCYFAKGADEYMCPDHGRAPWCPLVEVPAHGRLIDADALMGEFEKSQRTMQQHGREYSFSFLSSSQELSTEWFCVEDMLENAPTIIPAEEDTP